MLPRLLAVTHAVVFAITVWTAPIVGPDRDPECPPDVLCLSSADDHRMLVAGRDIGDWWTRKLFILADLPAVIASGFLGYVLLAAITSADDVALSWIFGALWLALGTLQWWTIGRAISRRRARSAPVIRR